MPGQELCDQVERHIVRADAEDGSIQFSFGAIQPHLHLLACFGTLRATRHQHQSIRADERGDNTRSPRKRRGQQFFAYTSYRHTDKVVISPGGGDLTRQLGGFGRQFFGAAAQPTCNEWLDEDVDRQCGRDGVAGNADDRDFRFLICDF